MLTVWILHQMLGGAQAAKGETFQPEPFFNAQCSGCHSVGKGEVVGPDLKGVVSRHSRPWLHAFIRSSQALVRAHDREAVDLFGRYRKVMPDHEMETEQIDQLLAFIEKGGPRGEAELRLASAATAAERARGRRLFLGETRFANGAAACSRCHAAGESSPAFRGGRLASDLTHVYGKYGDWALSRAIVEPRFPLMAEIYSGRPLTGDEAFAVGAYLYDASRGTKPGQPVPARSGGLPLLGFGSSALVLLLAGRDSRRR